MTNGIMYLNHELPTVFVASHQDLSPRGNILQFCIYV
jgi:hypothetical protein